MQDEKLRRILENRAKTNQNYLIKLIKTYKKRYRVGLGLPGRIRAPAARLFEFRLRRRPREGLAGVLCHGGGARWWQELRLVMGNRSTPSTPATVDDSAPTRSSLTRQSGGARPRQRSDGGGNRGDG